MRKPESRSADTSCLHAVVRHELLECMREEAGGKGVVLPCLSMSDWTNWSIQFRDRLLAAGIDRKELHEASATEKAVGFRQLRDLGITMRLWRGDNPLVVQRHAGHESLSTLQAYAVEFEHWTEADGVPFPALPTRLLESPRKVPGRFNRQNSRGKSCERRELLFPVRSAAQYRIDRRPTTGPAALAAGHGCERRELNPHGSYPART